MNAVVPPGVPQDQARLRVSLTAAHSLAELDQALELFAEVHASLPQREPAGAPG